MDPRRRVQLGGPTGEGPAGVVPMGEGPAGVDPQGGSSRVDPQGGSSRVDPRGRVQQRWYPWGRVQQG